MFIFGVTVVLYLIQANHDKWSICFIQLVNWQQYLFPRLQINSVPFCWCVFNLFNLNIAQLQLHHSSNPLQTAKGQRVATSQFWSRPLIGQWFRKEFVPRVSSSAVDGSWTTATTLVATTDCDGVRKLWTNQVRFASVSKTSQAERFCEFTLYYGFYVFTFCHTCSFLTAMPIFLERNTLKAKNRQ